VDKFDDQVPRGSLRPSRRGLIAGALTAGALGALAGGCSDESAPDWPRLRAGEKPRQGQTITDAVNVPKSGGVVIPEAGLVIVRDGDSGLRGFSAVCTHAGCIISDVIDGIIICPCHGSRFDAKTGAALSGPARTPLTPVAIKFDGKKVVIG
jgi:Rieske Fe-S protein